ncbi:Ferritin Dps family protein [Isosphaera pallida ATCC 43644]|uniref:Ferritin Dps family protein n=1 Tax=Isosphaera pallida (strain ATCC 43644 / DSM 9630 / IS1B) TaxID=575540 RepID=E8QWJ7_ISOPI|nr:ferritin-like domain-containing protein [Isosphaera pallida]ADV61889.1 Ferritin Dps family protein [Isosphaera pallida ATCC 43644]
MNNNAMIQKLNEILKWEYAGLIQYTQFSFLVSGLHREVYEKFFRKNGEEALSHAQQVGDRIVTLGGIPTVERGEVNVSNDLVEMLKLSHELESRHARLYAEALAMCGESNLALRLMLEEIGRDEQEGADHIEKLLKGLDAADTTAAQPSAVRSA